MTAKSATEALGFEFDWLARDADGHVGLFSTAGGGHAPEAFLLDTGRHDAAIEMLLGMPAGTSALFSPHVAPGLDNTWRQVAERGLFAFDSDPGGGPYRLVAAPEVPIQIDNLPSAVADVAAAITFSELRFVALRVISAGALRSARRHD